MKGELLKLVALVFLSHFKVFGQFSSNDILVEEIPGSDQRFTMKMIAAGELETPSGKIASLDSFYIGTHEVIHDLFVLFKRKEYDSSESDLSDDYTPDAVSRPSPPYEDLTWGMGDEGGYPAVSMTQQSALRFCEWLYLKTGRFYRLPTEAEWTFVALQNEHKDDDGHLSGWFLENSQEKYHLTEEIVNINGIHDLFGNVLEWTLDSWEDEFLESQESKCEDPWVIPSKKHYRVLKGGSYYDSRSEVNAWTRFKSERKWQERDPQIPKSKWWLTDGSFVGFRLVSPVSQPSTEEINAFFLKAIVD